MNAKVIVLSMIVFLMPGSSWVFADSQSNSADVAADRSRYQRLLREVKSVDAEYHRALQRALVETKKNGKASLETKSELLALTDQRDRILNRVTLLSLRHGWDIPVADGPDANISEIPDERQRIFEPAEQMIKDKFSLDARRIVGRITLPLIPIESEAKGRHSKKGRRKNG